MHAFQLPSSYHTLQPDARQPSHAAKREDGTTPRERAQVSSGYRRRRARADPLQDTTHNVISSPPAGPAAGPEVTPCMTVDDDSASLTTPKHPGDSSEISASFIFPSRSYDVQVSLASRI